MSDYDRRYLDPSWENSFETVEVKIHGGTTVEKGDLLFLDKANKLRSRGSSSADWYGYPFSVMSGTTLTLASNKTLAARHFLGVAAWHSDYGVTETITTYTGGLFQYSLKNSRSIKVGQYAAPTGSGVTLYNQKVQIESTSTDYIGYAGDGGSFRSRVNVVLLSRAISGVSREI